MAADAVIAGVEGTSTSTNRHCTKQPQHLPSTSKKAYAPQDAPGTNNFNQPPSPHLAKEPHAPTLKVPESAYCLLKKNSK